MLYIVILIHSLSLVNIFVRIFHLSFNLLISMNQLPNTLQFLFPLKFSWEIFFCYETPTLTSNMMQATFRFT